MDTYRQLVDEIRDAPEIVTSSEFEQQEQRLLANAATSKERLNGRFQQAFPELTATLSLTLVTQLGIAKRITTRPINHVGADDTPKGGITEHDARRAQLSTERHLITPTVRPLPPAPATTVNRATLPYEDYHIDTDYGDATLPNASSVSSSSLPPTSRRPTSLNAYL
jgi:hypothetical protein